MRHHQTRRPPAGTIASIAIAVLLASAAPASAQIPVSLSLDGAFYGDNTEFDGQFRTGETILGAFQRVVFEARLSDRAAVRFGVFAQERAGSHSAVDRALPIVALEIGSCRQRLVLGTLDPSRPRAPGPDRTTPHGLLPPLAVETLWFTRAYEAGVQWIVRGDRLTQDVWFDYQLGNTAGHREKFDTGGAGRIRVFGPFSAAYQFHVVHHGGQQFASGPVSDSFGFGPGLVAEGALAGLASASLEVYVLGALDRPDRAARAHATTEGRAVFVRAAAERAGWRGHVIAWRGDDFDHEDGDANYLSRLPDGTPYRGTRDYGEVGLSRLFRPAPGLDFEASVRLHRVESHVTYSYRLLGTVHLDVWHGTIGPAR